MPSKKSRSALAALTPEALAATPELSPEALQRMTWAELTEWAIALETLYEGLRFEMNSRETHICQILSLSADDLEAYVRDQKPEWEFAKTELENKRGAGK